MSLVFVSSSWFCGEIANLVWSISLDVIVYIVRSVADVGALVSKQISAAYECGCWLRVRENNVSLRSNT